MVPIVNGEYHALLLDPANLRRNNQVFFRNDIDEVYQSSLLGFFTFFYFLLSNFCNLREILNDFNVDLPLRLTYQGKINYFLIRLLFKEIQYAVASIGHNIICGHHYWLAPMVLLIIHVAASDAFLNISVTQAWIRVNTCHYILVFNNGYVNYFEPGPVHLVTHQIFAVHLNNASFLAVSDGVQNPTVHVNYVWIIHWGDLKKLIVKLYQLRDAFSPLALPNDIAPLLIIEQTLKLENFWIFDLHLKQASNFFNTIKILGKMNNGSTAHEYSRIWGN